MRLLILLFSCCISCTLWAANTTRINVGYYEFPPYIWSDENGQPQGPLFEMTERLLHHSHYQGVYRSLPSARLYKALRDGSIHLWPGTAGKAELRGFTLEGHSITGDFTLALFYREDTPTPTLPESLRNSNLISILGYSYSPAIYQLLSDPKLNIRQHRTSNRSAALAMLLRKRGDYLLDYLEPVEQTSREQNIAPLPYSVVQELKGQMIVSRRAPNSSQLIQDLDRAHAELTAQGLISPISFD